MRFSYIDSQGKEIEVDSVESLALRIELGAIQADTRMYDAVADRWAPAEEHPVFRSLSRGEELTEADVVHIGQEEEGGAGAAAGDAPEDDGAGAVEEETEEVGGEPDEEVAATGGDEGTGEGDELALGFTVTLTDEEQGAGEEEAVPSAEAEAADAGAEALEPADAVEEAEGGDAGDGEGDDFLGGLDTLELEEEPTGESGEEQPTPEGFEEPPAGEAEEPAPAPDPSPPPEAEAPPQEPASETPPAADEDLPPWAAEGEALWGDEEDAGTDEGGRGDPAAGTGFAEGEGPPAPPGPGEGLPEWAAEEPAEPSAGAGPVEEPAEERRREKPTAPRPAHWEERTRSRERRRRLIRVAGAAILLIAAGVTGAYFMGMGPFERAEETVKGAVRPVLSPELRAVATEVAEAAYADVLGRFAEEWAERELPERPPEEWLEGIYLSTAGDYPGVRSYWASVADAVETLRGRESELFGQRLDERLDQRTGSTEAGEPGGLNASRAGRIREAVLFDYRATAPDRAEEYGSVLAVADASRDLHALLVERQADIAYEPYSDPGVSRDPVLEAVPADSVLRAEMNARLDRVLEAVTASGIPRPITTEALAEHLLGRLEGVGVVLSNPPQTGDPGAP